MMARLGQQRAVRWLEILRRAGHNVVLAMARGPFVMKPGIIRSLCSQQVSMHGPLVPHFIGSGGPACQAEVAFVTRWQIRNFILVHIASLKHLFHGQIRNEMREDAVFTLPHSIITHPGSGGLVA